MSHFLFYTAVTTASSSLAESRNYLPTRCWPTAQHTHTHTHGAATWGNQSVDHLNTRQAIDFLITHSATYSPQLAPSYVKPKLTETRGQSNLTKAAPNDPRTHCTCCEMSCVTDRLTGRETHRQHISNNSQHLMHLMQPKNYSKWKSFWNKYVLCLSGFTLRQVSLWLAYLLLTTLGNWQFCQTNRSS